MQSVREVSISPGTRVLVRCDIDVPLVNGEIEDTYRLDHLIPTLKLLREKQARVIIAGHISRPEGKYVEELSTKHLRPYFDEQLGADTYELLENLRFDSRERTNDPAYAQELAQKADIYVNESFANSHREHTSIVGVPKLLSSFAGLRLKEEVDTLSKILTNPDKPLVAVIGGAKIETKKPLIKKFVQIADHVLVGGKIALDWDEEIPPNLHLAVDSVGPERKDIGPQTVRSFNLVLQAAKTIIWAGPLGMFEQKEFENGTKLIAEIISESPAFCVAGGGDTKAAIQHFNLEGFDFVSTGGGAMLEFLVQGNLPGLEVLGYHG